MDRKTLRNLRDELATTRLDHDARKRGLDCARELWEKEHATQIADTRTAAQLVAAYETQVRDGAVAIYDMFKDTDVALAKHPVEGVDIRIYTNVTYDASVVTRWIYGRLLTLVLGLHAQGVSTDGILDELEDTTNAQTGHRCSQGVGRYPGRADHQVG
jgi:hypothetical protein